MSATLVLVGLALMALSGLPSVLVATPRGRRAATATLALAAATLVAGATLGLIDPAGAAFATDWSLPFGRFAIDLDVTSALFLLPVAIVPVLGTVYGHGYIDADPDHWSRGTAQRIRLFYGLLAASLGLLVVARDAILFLFAWEGMALGSFFLITVDDRDDAARAAGWVYLVATHLGMLAIFAMFALIGSARGDTALAPLAAGAVSPAGASAIFVLAVVGFGLKAGLMPLHVWLPPAHAAAPSHVSAMLSGVVTKMGIYGLVRVVLMLPAPPAAWGTALVVLGSISAIAALVFALGQSDLKRMLAYSTIENIGIITIALGLALIGRALGRGDLVVLGIGGLALHVLAHSLMKTLLFFAAGAVIHATHTRNLEAMGGLARRMPHTLRLFTLGALAICALPPLSGFASELLVYLGVFAGPSHLAAGPTPPGLAALAAPALALTGALALATFVRALGIAFLGEPRSAAAAHAHESPPTMLAPMAIAAALIVLLGLAPAALAPLVDALAAEFAGPGAAPLPPLASLAPLMPVTVAGLALIAATALVFALLRRRVRRVDYRTVPTWDCGYARPDARMQYTASSFGTTLVNLFGWLVRPAARHPTLTAPFPAASQADEVVPDAVLDRLVVPVARRAEKSIQRLRVLQQGNLHAYIFYILLAVLGLFLGLGL